MSDIFDSEVLDRDVHGQLVAERVKVFRAAGIPGREDLIGVPLGEVCPALDVMWMTKFDELSGNGDFGAYYEGKIDPPVEVRFPIMVACLLRNFRATKLMSVVEVLDDKEGEADQCTALFIPNLFSGKAEAGYLHPGAVQRLYDLLMRRVLGKRQTVVWFSSLKMLRSEWGWAFYDLIEKNYVELSL